MKPWLDDGDVRFYHGDAAITLTTRPVRSHEYLFLLSKQERYVYDADAVKETGADGKLRNARTVWSIPRQRVHEAHFATYPEELVRRCILAGSRAGDTVLDPFIGSGTTALVARQHGRRAVGIDLKEEYLQIAAKRTERLSLLAGA